MTFFVPKYNTLFEHEMTLFLIQSKVHYNIMLKDLAQFIKARLKCVTNKGEYIHEYFYSVLRHILKYT